MIRLVTIDWMFVSSQNSYTETIFPWGDFGGRLFGGRCSCPEGRVFRSRIRALIKQTKGTPSLILPYADTTKICPFNEPESGLSTDTEYSNAMILDYPAFRTMRNKFLFFSSLWYFAVTTQTNKDTDDLWSWEENHTDKVPYSSQHKKDINQ